jgi:ABC-type multidrug transport system ATPase subunit
MERKLSPSPPLFRSSRLVFSVPGRGKILDLKPFSVPCGNLIFILGKNGAGKSTLLSVMAGHTSPDEGDLFWKDNRIKPLKDRLVKGFEGIGLVKQEPVLDPFLTVRDELEKSIRHLPEKIAAKKLNYLIKTLKLKDLLGSKNGNLSGGEKRRLGIALALAKDCELLLLDEPFADLDTENRLLLSSVFSELKSGGSVSVVVVSHIGSAAIGLADQVWTIRNGKWIEKSKRGTGIFSPKQALTASLMGMKNILKKKDFPLLSCPDGTGWIQAKSEQITLIPKEQAVDLGEWKLVAAEQRDGGLTGVWKKRNRDHFLESRLEESNEKISSGLIFRLYFNP